jgi:flagellar basal-body rod protein FlgG
MNGAFHVGAIGLRAPQRALELVSNNIANVNTPTFKRADLRFVEMMAVRSDPEVARSTPDANLTASGVTVRAARALETDGAMESTGRPTDLAVRGRGFIELMGPGGRTLLWRGGALTTLEDGALAAADSGLPLRAALSVPAGAALAVTADGTVTARTGEAESVELGQIALVMPRDPGAIEAIDGGLYAVASDADLEELTAGEDGAGAFVQGSVERSNVEITAEMVALMLVQRAYAANAQVVQAADQLMATANGLRR